MVCRFGADITEAFCARNNLGMIIRSHQAAKQGYGYEVMHHGMCVRVFSARDYDRNANDGSILSVKFQDDKLCVRAQILQSLIKDHSCKDGPEHLHVASECPAD